jgi:hypothetical protein
MNLDRPAIALDDGSVIKLNHDGSMKYKDAWTLYKANRLRYPKPLRLKIEAAVCKVHGGLSKASVAANN